MVHSIVHLVFIAAATLGAGATEAATHTTACHPRAVDIRDDNNAVPGDFLCVRGEPAAVKLELHETTVSAALAKLLAAYNVSYHSSIALNDIRDGTYKGPLRQVILRLLDGYDFIIARDGANLHVVILAKKGEHAIAAPAPIQVSENVDERPAVHGSRDH
jgi:hypothetical protein